MASQSATHQGTGISAAGNTEWLHFLAGRFDAMRVLIVDDHEVTRLGLKALLAVLEADLQTVEAGKLEDAVEIGRRGDSFDLVLLDVHLPDGNGIERLQRLKEIFEGTPIVVMSAENSRSVILSAIEAGASGYIPKDTDKNVTLNAWRLVLASGMYLPPEVLRPVSTAGTAPAAQRQPRPSLNEKQLAVLQRLLHGCSNKVIARQLGISEGAVKQHLSHIFDKLGVATRLQAMAKAQELGYFESLTKLSG